MSSFLSGLFGTFGFIVAIILCLITIAVVKGKKKPTAAMFEDYLKVVVEEEDYMEAVRVKDIISAIREGRPIDTKDYKIESKLELIDDVNEKGETEDLPKIEVVKKVVRKNAVKYKTN